MKLSCFAAFCFVLVLQFASCTDCKRKVEGTAKLKNENGIKVSFVEHPEQLENSGGASASIDEFHTIRDSLLAICLKHGTTGPDSQVESPVYWLVDSYLSGNRQELQVCSPDGWTVEWLFDVVELSTQVPDWNFLITGIGDGMISICDNELRVAGPLFSSSGDLKTIAETARTNLRLKIVESEREVNEAMAYIQKLLPNAMLEADRSGFSYLVTVPSKAGATVWNLQKQDVDELHIEEGCGDSERPVTANGCVLQPFNRDYWPHTDVQPPYWLVSTFFEGPPREMTVNLIDENGERVAVVELNNVFERASK